MKTIKIAKAEPIGEKEVVPVTIVIDDQIPQNSYPVFNVDAFYSRQAYKLARVLGNSLPQGTLDRLIINLMKRKASLYRGLTLS